MPSICVAAVATQAALKCLRNAWPQQYYQQLQPKCIATAVAPATPKYCRCYGNELWKHFKVTCAAAAMAMPLGLLAFEAIEIHCRTLSEYLVRL